MDKRFTENINSLILAQMEALTGKRADEKYRNMIMHGPDEVDLVYSGLEETMIQATREVVDAWRSNPEIPDMRTAAYFVAINKVANTYEELGIFP
jgi:glutamate dehydrogenase (NAD(P)+)